VDDFRGVLQQLFHGRAGNRKRHFERRTILTDQVHHQFIGRKVGSFGHSADDHAVLKVIVILMVMPDIEKPVDA
jgi:hypothetical protein